MTSGEVLNDALDGYRAFWRYLGPLALAIGLAVAAFSIVLVLALGQVGIVAAAIIGIVANFWTVGLLVQTVDDLLDGSDETWIGARFERFWPAVNAVSVGALVLSLVLAPGVALLATQHVVLGLLFLVAAAAVLTFLALALPLIVIEGYGVGAALARSRELVSGRAWKVFWVLMVAGVLTGVLSAAVERLALEASSPVPAVLLSSAFDTLVLTPFLALTLSSLYYTLNDEGRVPATAPAA